jgi:hypothetical protein
VSNVYFNNFAQSGEQKLIEDLIIESINIYGHDVFYLPRTLINKDDIYGEDTVSEYNNHYNITMYIRSYDNFQGDGTFLSKFNLEIRDQIVFTVSQRVINDQLDNEEEIRRPQEGDLIYSSMFKRMFVINYVDKKAIFYQLGALQTYDLTCETWEYSNEKLRTGIPEIDALEEKYSFDLEAQGIITDTGHVLVDQDGFAIIISDFDYDTQLQDWFADNDEISEEAVPIVDWSERDPFSEGF